jgi:lipoprotein NlpD
MAGSGSRRRLERWWLLGWLVSLAACFAERGVYHQVRRGENLYRIGKAYGIPYAELARRNGIRDPSKIEVGQKIFVPGAARQVPVEIVTPRYAVGERPRVSGERRSGVPSLPADHSLLRWPMASGSLSSRFGPRNHSFHDGIDIAAPEGTPVYAARAGRVIYSDEIPGYGNLVIVEHDRGFSTVYAHNSRNEVDVGEDVRAGEMISRVGRTGRTTGANLHFEVRLGNVAHDPLDYLPPLASASR